VEEEGEEQPMRMTNAKSGIRNLYIAARD